MNQQELEALLKQIAPNNDPGRLTFTEDTTTVERQEPGAYVGADPVKKKVPVRVLTWVDRGTGQTLVVHANPDGTYTKQSQGIDPKMQGEPATTPAQVAKDEQGVPAGSRQETDSSGKTVKVTTYKRPDGTTYEITESVQAAPEKPQPGKPYQNAQGQWVTPVVGPDGSVTTKPLPPEAVPRTPAEDISAPPTQKWVVRRTGDTYETVKNPNYRPPSTIKKDEETGQWIEITLDDNDKPIVRPVDDKTRIKPADLPALQAKYGEIAQGLGALAQDLNSRYARGEITEKQKNDAFTAAHQQAQTQVSEINSILSTSKSIWEGEISQRGQTLNETQSRRSYASGLLGNALETGNAISKGAAGPGAGRDIVNGMAAILGVGQQLAQNTGGFRESPEVALPAALQQARGIGLPGYGDGPAAAPPSGPSGADVAAANAATQAQSRAAFGGLGIAPPSPLLRPPPPVPGQSPVAPIPNAMPGQGAVGSIPNAMPGQGAVAPIPNAPPMASMGAALGSAQGYAGSPVAAGGGGVWDPTADVQGMIGDGSDPAWAEAVRQAAGTVSQPGYAWQRFAQPASRFG